MKTTKIHSIATNWKKNSMMGAVPGTSNRAAVWVVVLQILGVNGSMKTTLGWSQNGFSMVLGLQTYWERSTNFVCIENLLIPSCDERNLCLPDRHIWCKLLHLDHVRAWLYESQDLARNDRGPLWNSSWCISSSNIGLDDTLSFLVFPISVAMKSSLLNYVLWNLREIPMYIQRHLGWPQFLSRDARMCDRRRLHFNMIGILCNAS